MKSFILALVILLGSQALFTNAYASKGDSAYMAAQYAWREAERVYDQCVENCLASGYGSLYCEKEQCKRDRERANSAQCEMWLECRTQSSNSSSSSSDSCS